MSQSVNFDRAVEYYDQTRGFPPGVEQNIPDLFIRAGSLTPTSRVLEIGIGTGRIALPLASHVGAYYGIDISSGMMGKLIDKRANEPIYPVQGDASKLPFADASFDAVTAVHVFHLIPAWRDVLTELKRVLKPNAPLLHGWNGRVMENRMMKLWNDFTGRGHEIEGAIPIEKRESFLLDNGWTLLGDEQIHYFTIEQTPREFLENVRERRWSHCWRMSDDEIARGLEIVEAFARDNYASMDELIRIEANFHVQAYLPAP